MRVSSTLRLFGSIIDFSGILGRPVKPGDDDWMCDYVLAARRVRGLQVNSHLSKTERAQGMPGARCTRDLVCNLHKKMRTRAYRAAEAIRHSLRNGFTAYFVLSLATGLSCHHRLRMNSQT
jgi:hypothetical protein